MGRRGSVPSTDGCDNENRSRKTLEEAMSATLTILSSLAVLQAPITPPAVDVVLRPHDPVLNVWVDSASSEVVIQAGPFDLPAKVAGATMDMPMGADATNEHDHSQHDRSPLMRVDWPVDGWMRGFSLKLTEEGGGEVPMELLHHFVAVNFERRQLVYPVVERLFAVGQETESVLLPSLIGVPVSKGNDLGFYAMWSNTLGRDLEVNLELRIPFLSEAQRPQFEVLPLYLDANNIIGGTSTFDLVPGVNRKGWEFTVPSAVTVLGVGGHLHDYGEWVRIEDAETDSVLVQLNTERDETGHVLSVERKELFEGAGLRFEPGKRYRIVGQYDNPTPDPILDGAMIHIMGIVVPDDPGAWPSVDPTSKYHEIDLAGLPPVELRPEDAGDVGQRSGGERR